MHLDKSAEIALSLILKIYHLNA